MSSETVEVPICRHKIIDVDNVHSLFFVHIVHAVEYVCRSEKLQEKFKVVERHQIAPFFRTSICCTSINPQSHLQRVKNYRKNG